MRKVCPICSKKFDGTGKKKYCSPKCKKNYENSKRNAPKRKPVRRNITEARTPSPEAFNRPQGLNREAGAYWDKVAPTVVARGHLNILSEDAFAELCDLYSRLRDINAMINVGTTEKCEDCGKEMTIPGNRSLLQLDDKWDNKTGTETRSFKESALSDLKRKYSRQFLDYCKQFYLTPLSNRGSFGLEDIRNGENEKENDKERLFS